MLKLNHSARLLDWRGAELEDHAEEGRENKKTGWKVEEENCSTEMETGREKKKNEWGSVRESASGKVSTDRRNGKFFSFSQLGWEATGN